MMTVAFSPGANVPTLHSVGSSTSPGVPMTQLPEKLCTESMVTPAGTTSEITTFVAVDGPWFSTNSV